MAKKNESTVFTSNTDDELKVSYLFELLWGKKWLIFSSVVFATVLGAIISLYFSPQYQADALVQLNSNPDDMTLSATSSDEEIQWLKSRAVIDKTIKDLSLTVLTKESSLPIIGELESQFSNRNEKNLKIESLSVPEEVLDQKMKVNFIDAENFTLSFDGKEVLKGKVGEEASSNGFVIKVASTDALAGTSFDVVKRNFRSVINEIQIGLTAIETAKSSGLISVTLVGETPESTELTLKTLLDNYVANRTERRKSEAEENLLYLKVRIGQLRDNLDDAEASINKMGGANIVNSGLPALANPGNGKNKVATEGNQKTNELGVENDDLNSVNDNNSAQEIIRLSRNIMTGQEIYISLLDKQQQINTILTNNLVDVKVVDQPMLDNLPLPSKRKLIVIAAAFIGLLLSTLPIIIKATFSKKLKSSDELEAKGIKVVASVPRADNGYGSKYFSLGNLILSGTSPSLEALRSLRTTLQFSMKNQANRALMVSSATDDSGKTCLTVNLARLFALADSKVILIDADLKTGHVGQYISLSQTTGLAEYLSREISVESLINKDETSSLDIISSGSFSDNSSELLSRSKFKELIDWCNEKYDYIIINTPAILHYTDASIVGEHVGYSLLFARSNYNSIKEVSKSLEYFELNGINIDGVVLNDLQCS
ncbi:polysaccharide biosynthesis tyrosine autokinase [Rahnella victoriana]|uniref:Polysaccharide biosynthesis tyrosine autokinase n=1 Tax=Rahnella victoriana TaxID=1510570 RepID=A0ABS0DQ84_9GAMM|nr:polysaccharide biosynthesis tyrosine autokinase [Rahnella victoriana]MBF7956062.1 polysaccharide biosynthesis tyrosine autokinase [Rahnella victoriana]